MAVNWRPYRGCSILAGYGDYHKKHLCIITTNPIVDPEDGIEKVIITACCTFDGRLGNDDTCLIDQGEHPFFCHRSFIHYRRAVLVAVSQLQHDYEQELFVTKEDMSEELMARIEKGLRYHDATSDEVNDFYQHYLML